MIREGQIYRSEKENVLMCITKINNNSTYNYILNNGFTGYGCYAIEQKPIAEYPTWQEAVNSKEFKI